MGDSHNSKENTDPSSGVGGMFGWVGKQVTGMFGLLVVSSSGIPTFTRGLEKQCDAFEERVNEREKLIDTLPECSIRRHVRENNEDVSGSLNNEIAKSTNNSERTVEHHIANIKKKLGATTRHQLYQIVCSNQMIF